LKYVFDEFARDVFKRFKWVNVVMRYFVTESIHLSNIGWAWQLRGVFTSCTPY